MKYLPYEHLIFITDLTPGEIRKRLQKVVEPRKYIVFPGPHSKQYCGEIGESGFSIERLLAKRGMFSSVILGNFGFDNGKTVIDVVIRFHVLSNIILLYVLGGSGLAFLYFLFQNFRILFAPREAFEFPPSMGMLYSAGIFILSYVIPLILFKFEANQTREFFERSFGGFYLDEIGWHSLFHKDERKCN